MYVRSSLGSVVEDTSSQLLQLVTYVGTVAWTGTSMGTAVSRYTWKYSQIPHKSIVSKEVSCNILKSHTVTLV